MAVKEILSIYCVIQMYQQNYKHKTHMKTTTNTPASETSQSNSAWLTELIFSCEGDTKTWLHLRPVYEGGTSSISGNLLLVPDRCYVQTSPFQSDAWRTTKLSQQAYLISMTATSILGVLPIAEVSRIQKCPLNRVWHETWDNYFRQDLLQCPV